MKSWRSTVSIVLFSLIGAAVVGRLIFLQVVKHDYYRALSEGEQRSLELSTKRRGEVFFRDGEPLAVNKTRKYVFISPREVEDREEVCGELSTILGVSEEEVDEKLQRSGFFEIIKKEISNEEEIAIISKNLVGVYIDDEPERHYPQGEITAHITGFVSDEGKGYYGLEGHYDEYLRGAEKISKVERGPFGFFSDEILDEESQDLHTTINPYIQYAAYNILKENRESLNFRSGQVLVMDPSNGEILTMAQYPGYDPNEYSSSKDAEIFRNYMVHTPYEPGSIFKPITMASAINEQRVTPDTTYVDTGEVSASGYTIHNYDNRVWGEQSMTNVLERSINTGAVFAEKRLGHNLFVEYLKRFGLFEKTGVDIQGEAASKNDEVKKGYEINYLTAAFGQGISVSPMQMIRAFSAIPNGGEMVTPHFIKDSDTESQKVLSDDTALDLTNMLVSVVENGYAKSAQVEGYYLAGKTGTAQIPWAYLGINRRGYSDETIQTFIGFFPAYEPKYLMLVKLDAPETKTAEYSAVPIFQKLAKYIINVEGIPPSRLDD